MRDSRSSKERVNSLSEPVRNHRVVDCSHDCNKFPFGTQQRCEGQLTAPTWVNLEIKTVHKFVGKGVTGDVGKPSLFEACACLFSWRVGANQNDVYIWPISLR